MKRPLEIAAEQANMQTIVSLTDVFEGLASMRIMRSKDRVLKSRSFFDDIWQIYSQIRVSDEFRYGRSGFERANNKELYLLVTNEAGLGGDIDQRLIATAMRTYDAHKNDIVIIGKRGHTLLQQHNTTVLQYFKLPTGDDFSVEPVVECVKKYRNTKVFYESYESLTRQAIKTIDLGAVVKSREDADRGKTLIDEGGYAFAVVNGRDQVHDTELIDESSYIFEPSVRAVVTYFEQAMIRLTVTEAILDSRLAQDASRFRAMSQANDSANDTAQQLRSQFYHARRAVVDQRLREIMCGLKQVRSHKV